MDILFISDTHGSHHLLQNLPKADIIIHAGDVTSRGQESEAEDFLLWFGGLNYQYKVFIAGNHDFWFEDKSIKQIQQMLPSNAHYLCDSGVEIEGINFWGSPISPWFYDWAFNRDRGFEIRKYWKMIPKETNLLITHTPPFGILDTTTRAVHTGCEDLLNFIRAINPKYHLFGHIHEGYGMIESGETTFINGSVLNEYYDLQNAPILFKF